ncbi:MAG: hypothetical protein N2560_01910 [Ignavibacteria bacterium]|nr:hypothetical protein [Ignavibacteria bacterium]
MEVTKTKKLFVALFFIGCIIWIGGSIIRTAIVYDIYEPYEKSLKFRYWVDEKIALMTVRHFSIGALYTAFGFLLTFISFLNLFSWIKTRFKTDGWLLMSVILYILSVISELILLYFDLRLGLYVFFQSNISYFSNEIQTFFFRRFVNYNFLMVYNWLAIFTIIFFLLFKPLKKNER